MNPWILILTFHHFHLLLTTCLTLGPSCEDLVAVGYGMEASDVGCESLGCANYYELWSFARFADKKQEY
jgi:hypothetical protein